MNQEAKENKKAEDDRETPDPKKIKEAAKHAEQRRGTKRGEQIAEKEDSDSKNRD